MFPQQWRTVSRSCRKMFILIHMDKCRIKHAFQFKLFIKRFCNIDNLKIRLRSSSDDHLRTLSCRNKPRRIPIDCYLILILSHLALHKTHRRQYIFSILMWSKLFKSFCCRKLQIHAHPVCQKSCSLYQFLIRSWNCLYMNVSLKMELCP